MGRRGERDEGMKRKPESASLAGIRLEPSGRQIAPLLSRGSINISQGAQGVMSKSGVGLRPARAFKYRNNSKEHWLSPSSFNSLKQPGFQYL
jgi:hypothetical protein